MNSVHIFCYLTSSGWYRAPACYDDAEFEDLMNLLHWRLPYNMKVYHGQQGGWEKNQILASRPVLPIGEQQFFSSTPSGLLKFQDRKRNEVLLVLFRIDNSFIAQTEDQYGRFYSLDVDDPGRLVAPLTVNPISLKKAQTFVEQYHRHNDPPHFHKFSICLTAPDEPAPVGVAIAGRPKARSLDDNVTLEIVRCCSDGRYANVCSKLYGHMIRAGREMGYRRFITYTSAEEPGSSLRAAGFSPVATVRPSPGGWNSPGRPRPMPRKLPLGEKIRWQLEI